MYPMTAAHAHTSLSRSASALHLPNRSSIYTVPIPQPRNPTIRHTLILAYFVAPKLLQQSSSNLSNLQPRSLRSLFFNSQVSYQAARLHLRNPSCLHLNMAAPLLEFKAAATASTLGYASPSEWNRVRPIIKRLYVDEDKTLKEVMTIMARDYGHHAS